MTGKQAERCAEILSKGDKVYVEGRLSQEKWIDKEENERTTLSVNCSEVQLLNKYKICQ